MLCFVSYYAVTAVLFSLSVERVFILASVLGTSWESQAQFNPSCEDHDLSTSVQRFRAKLLGLVATSLREHLV